MNRNVLVISIYFLLFLFSIPWYWGAGDIGNRPFIFALPLWFCVSVLGSLAISIYTAVLIAVFWQPEPSEKLDSHSNDSGDA